MVDRTVASRWQPRSLLKSWSRSRAAAGSIDRGAPNDEKACMQQRDLSSASQPAGALKGLRAWIITDGKAGMVVPCKGVADALGLDYELKQVETRGFWRLIAPYGPVQPSDRPGRPGALLAPPWPDIAIACGRASIPYIRAIKHYSRGETFTIVLQDPRIGNGVADLIWVPEHDPLRGDNVVVTVTSPHSYSPERLERLRRALPPEILALPQPRITVVLGGKNGSYKFTDADDERFAKALAALGRLGASFMITPSRRTHDRLLRVADEATRDRPRILWDGTGPNPYPNFLAGADYLVVTADSVNMTGEACATGRPVYVFEPSRGSTKFRKFHQRLQGIGATRLLPSNPERLEDWSYAPIDSASVIAKEVERRYLLFRNSQR